MEALHIPFSYSRINLTISYHIAIRKQVILNNIKKIPEILRDISRMFLFLKEKQNAIVHKMSMWIKVLAKIKLEITMSPRKVSDWLLSLVHRSYKERLPGVGRIRKKCFSPTRAPPNQKKSFGKSKYCFVKSAAPHLKSFSTLSTQPERQNQTLVFYFYAKLYLLKIPAKRIRQTCNQNFHFI